MAKPYGAWRFFVDINNQSIIRIEDIRQTRREKEPIDFRKYKGKISDRREAFEAFRRKQKNKDSVYKPHNVVDLTTRIFDLIHAQH